MADLINKKVFIHFISLFIILLNILPVPALAFTYTTIDDYRTAISIPLPIEIITTISILGLLLWLVISITLGATKGMQRNKGAYKVELSITKSGYVNKELLPDEKILATVSYEGDDFYATDKRLLKFDLTGRADSIEYNKIKSVKESVSLKGNILRVVCAFITFICASAAHLSWTDSKAPEFIRFGLTMLLLDLLLMVIFFPFGKMKKYQIKSYTFNWELPYKREFVNLVKDRLKAAQKTRFTY
jgi:hypothetical protein